MEQRIINVMKELGFTATDARAYIALLKNNPSTGYELAARSGVPRSAIYGVLKRLESIGLINAIQQKPTKYLPLTPDRLLEYLEARVSRSLTDLKKSLDKLPVRVAESRTWTVQGYAATLERAEVLVASSRESLYASLWRREAERLAAPLEQLRAAGVHVVLFSFNPLPQGLGRVLSYGIPEAELERYWQHRMILISDHARVLVGGTEQGDAASAVVTEEPALVEMAISNLVLDMTLLGQRTGADTADVVSGLTARLAPVDDLVATAMQRR